MENETVRTLHVSVSFSVLFSFSPRPISRVQFFFALEFAPIFLRTRECLSLFYSVPPNFLRARKCPSLLKSSFSSRSRTPEAVLFRSVQFFFALSLSIPFQSSLSSRSRLPQAVLFCSAQFFFAPSLSISFQSNHSSRSRLPESVLFRPVQFFFALAGVDSIVCQRSELLFSLRSLKAATNKAKTVRNWNHHKRVRKQLTSNLKLEKNHKFT